MIRGLELKNLTITDRGAPIVSLDLRVEPGEIVTIMGPSGSGKSTLLNALIGALPPIFSLQGQILLDGSDITHVPTRARRVGILFQDDVLFPHLSVGGNLAFAVPRAVRGRAARAALVAEALVQAGLPEFETRDPATLSGGQRARVALMRTLLADPRVLLLDEPFSKLDADLRDRTRSFVFQRARDRGLPVLLVTHDALDARAAGGRVVSPRGLPVDLG